MKSDALCVDWPVQNRMDGITWEALIPATGGPLGGKDLEKWVQ